MVIVHVVDSALRGGVGAMVRGLALAQSKLGQKVVVVSRSRDKEELKEWFRLNGANDIKYYAIEKFRLYKPTIFGGLSKNNYKIISNEFENEKVLLHFHNLIAFGWFSFTGISKIVCTIHGYFDKTSPNITSRIVAKITMFRLIKKNAVIVGCCKGIVDYGKNKWKNAELQFVLNGSIQEKKGNNLYDIDDSFLNICFVARIDELKGWRYLAEAYQNLPNRVKGNIRLYFAGRINKNDRLDFLKFIDHPNVFYLGEIPDVKTSVIPFMTALVLPSRTEGLPMSILEAMQYGCIPIATNVGGIAEIIENNTNGLIIARKSDSIGRAITMLYDNPDLVKSLQKNAIEWYNTAGTATIMAQNYAKIYFSKTHCDSKII